GPLGFVELDVVEQAIDGRQLRELVADLPRVDDSQSIVSAVPALAISAVICTRDRVSMLRTALQSVQAVDYPHLEIIVVDNAGAT
ncbi:glycosyl transferase family 2, partial [Mycobacterium sp. ITM-2017-0098]